MHSNAAIAEAGCTAIDLACERMLAVEPESDFVKGLVEVSKLFQARRDACPERPVSWDALMAIVEAPRTILTPDQLEELHRDQELDREAVLLAELKFVND